MQNAVERYIRNRGAIFFISVVVTQSVLVTERVMIQLRINLYIPHSFAPHQNGRIWKTNSFTTVYRANCFHLLQSAISIILHISRHSFAKAAKDAGIDNLEVKALLAHTNLSTTQKYMGDFDTQQNDAALDTIFKKDDEEMLLKQLQGVNPELLKKVLEKLSVK